MDSGAGWRGDLGGGFGREERQESLAVLAEFGLETGQVRTVLRRGEWSV